MRFFTDIFIRRPVLATVVSLLILVIGLRAAFSLPVRQYPETESAALTVTTTYYGADPEVIAGFITTPLEAAVAQANGIDYITSTSASGTSTITAHLQLNYDANRALNEINAKVSAVTNSLPQESQRPVLAIDTGGTTAAMYIAFNSTSLDRTQVTDYITRVVRPKLQAVNGVQNINTFGAGSFAMRAWLDPSKLAAFGLTAGDVTNALSVNNYISGLGNTKGQMVQVSLMASTSIHTLKEFRELIVKQTGDAIVRLKDIATVSLGSENYDTYSLQNGKPSTFTSVDVAPDANLLDVLSGVQKVFPQIKAQLPEGVTAQIVYDSSDFVNGSISEVERTIVEALIIVGLVVFGFLGSPRSVFIPVVAIPLSLIGAFIMMMALGFSINLLTLLAMVLAIGLVVDDAIIVVENVTRHMHDGMAPFDASIQGARELGGPIIAMTVVLVAVYVPIAFQSGLTGALFGEFAFTLVGAVIVSAIIALTLSPMLCSRFLKPRSEGRGTWDERFTDTIDGQFDKLHRFYERRLHSSLNFVPVTAAFAAIVLVSIYFLATGARSELAPQEDQSFLIMQGQGPANATLQQTELYSDQLWPMLKDIQAVKNIFSFSNPGSFFAAAQLKLWKDRDLSADDVSAIIQKRASVLPGVNLAIFQPSSLPGASGLPFQLILTTTQPYERLYETSQTFLAEARKTGSFAYIDTDLKYDLPQSTVEIDRSKAALLGLSMNDVGSTLSSMLGGGYVNYFTLDGRSYRVMAQVDQQFRLNADQLLNYYVRAADGRLVSLSTIAHITTKTIPRSLPHFQQQNAVTISGVIMPGQSLGDVLKSMKDLAARTLPDGYAIDYGGQSRQYVQESSGFVVTFAFAVVIIFLSLAALFESFRDPIVILISVPMSIAGALIFIYLGVGGATLNIYTEVGLVTLMGLISKHGILIVEVANRLQQEGHSKREALEMASGIRLRPILMTTAAMVLGVVPLVMASGAGAAARFNLGLVIASGIAIGTVFTLFVVPAFYMLLGTDHSKLRARQAAATSAV
jgi:multidrug efflux pump